jgi:hypothetical protein
MHYYIKRGLHTERLIRDIFVGWREDKEFAFSKAKQIKVRKKIGVDITKGYFL